MRSTPFQQNPRLLTTVGGLLCISYSVYLIVASCGLYLEHIDIARTARRSRLCNLKYELQCIANSSMIDRDSPVFDFFENTVRKGKENHFFRPFTEMLILFAHNFNSQFQFSLSSIEFQKYRFQRALVYQVSVMGCE